MSVRTEPTTRSVEQVMGQVVTELGGPRTLPATSPGAAELHERLGAAAWAELSRRELARVRPAGHVFRRDGDTWTLGYRGRQAYLPHAKGLADLAVLLAAPHREVPAYELLHQPGPPPGADPVLDGRARAGVLGPAGLARRRPRRRRRRAGGADRADPRTHRRRAGRSAPAAR